MIANILDGIVLGLQFGLLATGLTLVYGLGGVLNLAYGQIAVTSAITLAVAMDAGIPILPAVGLGLLAGGLLGLILDLSILRPVYRLRGKLLPLVRLDQNLGLGGDGELTDVYVLVLQADGRRFGVVVDRVLNTEEVVVKALTARFKDIGIGRSEIDHVTSMRFTIANSAQSDRLNAK